MDLAAKRQAVQVATDKGGSQRLAQLDQRPIGRMLDVVAREAAQDVLGSRGAESERGRILDHLVVLPGDQRPFDRSAQDRLQRWKGTGRAGGRPEEPLGVDPLEPRQQREAEEMAEGEGNRALYVDRLRFGGCRRGSLEGQRRSCGGTPWPW